MRPGSIPRQPFPSGARHEKSAPYFDGISGAAEILGVNEQSGAVGVWRVMGQQLTWLFHRGPMPQNVSYSGRNNRDWRPLGPPVVAPGIGCSSEKLASNLRAKRDILLSVGKPFRLAPGTPAAQEVRQTLRLRSVLAMARLQLEAGFRGVLCEHVARIERQIFQIHPGQL